MPQALGSNAGRSCPISQKKREFHPKPTRSSNRGRAIIGVDPNRSANFPGLHQASDSTWCIHPSASHRAEGCFFGPGLWSPVARGFLMECRDLSPVQWEHPAPPDPLSFGVLAGRIRATGKSQMDILVPEFENFSARLSFPCRFDACLKV